MKTFGAYVHARPNGQIFYVGKGTEKRAYNLRRNNHHHVNITTKHGKENILVGFVPCSSETIAFELEKGLIKCLRRNGVKLTNRTDGGEGLSNPSDETRAKIGKAHRGRVHTKETRAKMSRAGSGRKATDEARTNMSKALLGRVITAEWRANISRARLGCKPTEETRAKLSNARLGRKVTEETRAKLSKAGLGRRTTEETRAKLSKAQLNCKSTNEARAKMSKAILGRVYIHKTGESCRMIWPSDIDQFLSDGWSAGRGAKNGW